MPEHDDELRALRERAYGPESDIHEDAAARRRLHELEEQRRLARAPRSGSPRSRPATPPATDVVATQDAAPVGAAPVGAGAVGASAGDSAEHLPHAVAVLDTRHAGTAAIRIPAAANSAPSAGGPADRDRDRGAAWFRRRTPLLWVGSVVAAAIVGGVAGASLPSPDSREVAVLDARDTADIPSFDGTIPGAVVYDAFHGILVSSYAVEGEDEGVCLEVMTSANAFYAGGCSAGPFPAQATVVVDPTFPEELRDRFEDGTALQFEHDGSQVRVRAAAPTTPAP